MQEQESNLQNLELFLKFLKGDARVPDAFNWSLSISSKISAMKILYEEVLAQLLKCFDELKEIKQKGFGSGIECTKLAIKYEVFLNSIYALCENLSRVVRYLYKSKNLPESFREQKSRFLKDLNIDSVYSEILRKTNWYKEVQAIRAEATHYLSGFITVSSPTELGYTNIPKSKRNGTPKDISIKDVEKHIKGIYNDVLKFLSSFGNHFITVIDQNVSVVLVCLVVSGLIGAKRISLKEYLNGESGVCHTMKFDCPKKDSCEARKKANKS
jgi:hypothetical protein